MGDFVLTLHVAAALRAAVPEARIEMAARAPLAAFAVGRGPIDAAIDAEQLGLHHIYGHGSVSADVAERIHAYDLVISFLAGPQAHVSTRLRASARGLVLSVDPGPEPGAAVRHIVEQWLATLGTAGLRLALRQECILELSEAERAVARGKLGNLAGDSGGRTVLCHPGAGSRAKCCPLEVLETTARRLRDHGNTVLWMIGPTETDWYGQAYHERLSRSAAVLYEQSAPAAAALLGGADAFVGNDAGMTHVAAALGLETVALFGPTDPRVWRPVGPRVTALRFDATNESESLVEAIVARVGQAG